MDQSISLLYQSIVIIRAVKMGYPALNGMALAGLGFFRVGPKKPILNMGSNFTTQAQPCLGCGLPDPKWAHYHTKKISLFCK